jgi:hypothetical protein
MSKSKPQNEDPCETPLDDPRQKTDWPNTKQTNEPWKGPVEKEWQSKTDLDSSGNRLPFSHCLSFVAGKARLDIKASSPNALA